MSGLNVCRRGSTGGRSERSWHQLCSGRSQALLQGTGKPAVPQGAFPRPHIHDQWVTFLETIIRNVRSLFSVAFFTFFVTLSLFLFVSELDPGAERAHHLQQIIVTLQRPVIIVMRYLFAFLNQWVPSQLTPLFWLLHEVALIAFVPPVFLSTVMRTWWTPTT